METTGQSVSLQHFAAKVVEKVLLAAISGHTKKASGKTQHGFTTGKSMPALPDCFPQ